MGTKRVFLLLCLLSFGISASAQKSKSKSKVPDRLYRPNWSVKFNPLAVFAYTPGIEFGVEHSISDESILHFGASYLNDFSISENRNFQGYKLIGEYRHFNLLTKRTNNRYTSFQFHFKEAYAKGNTYVDRANGNYQQLFPLKARNTSFDFLIASGWIVPINDRLSADFALVYGAKLLSLDLLGIPEDSNLRFRGDGWLNFTLWRESSEWFPVLRLQVKLNFEL